jgi:uncharacterized protein with HEPN domain
MTQHDEDSRLRHMYDHAAEALGMIAGKNRQDLDADRMLNLALVRLLEIVGEAATHISEDTRAAIANVPWPQIVGLRNRLIHGYDRVDLDVLWKIVQQDLPALVAELAKVLEKGV